MPRRKHPFTCLQNHTVISSSSRDGIVYRIDSDIVFKAPHAWTDPTDSLLEEHVESVESIEREKAVYNRLRIHQPPHIISTILSAPEGIFLALANGGSLKQHLTKQRSIEWMKKLSWIRGIIQGELALVELGLVHGDLNLENVLLHNGQVKLCDLCATVQKGGTLIAPVFARFSIPVEGDDANMIASEQSETFAIGTCMYEIIMQHPPYPTMTEREVATLFGRGQFPPTSDCSFEYLGGIIQRCWTGRYKAMSELGSDFGALYDRLIMSDPSYKSMTVDVDELAVLESKCRQFLNYARSS